MDDKIAMRELIKIASELKEAGIFGDFLQPGVRDLKQERNKVILGAKVRLELFNDEAEKIIKSLEAVKASLKDAKLVSSTEVTNFESKVIGTLKSSKLSALEFQETLSIRQDMAKLV